jgi:hypothetical protein
VKALKATGNCRHALNDLASSLWVKSDLGFKLNEKNTGAWTPLDVTTANINAIFNKFFNELTA